MIKAIQDVEVKIIYVNLAIHMFLMERLIIKEYMITIIQNEMGYLEIFQINIISLLKLNLFQGKKLINMNMRQKMTQ